MYFKMFIFCLIILIMVSPSYQICERKLLINNNYNRRNIYKISCYGDNNWRYDCSNGEDYLVINSNNASSIDKSMFKFGCRITKISMTDGKIVKIVPTAFSKFSDLKYIDLSKNNISTILDGSFANENLVQVLNISRNKIQHIDEHGFYGLDNLQRLILHHNELKEFNYSSLKDKSLITLDLSFNKIADISNNHKNDNFSVVSLDLSYNQIKNVSKDLFPDPEYLQYLNLSGNGIEQIPLKTFLNCHVLLSLNLSDNQLHNLRFGVFNNLDNLQILDLSNNKLITNDLHTTLGLKSLNQLYFHDNSISEFKMNLLPANLTDISFYGNKFKFTCQELSEIISNLHRKGLRILNGKQYENDNFNGMECNITSFGSTINPTFVSSSKSNVDQLDFVKSINVFNERINHLIKVNEKSADEVNKNLQHISQILTEKRVKDKTDAMNDYFETKFKETDFYKFFKNFKAIEISKPKETNSSNNNVAVMERLISSSMVSEEDSILKSISVQFTIILILIVGFLILLVILRRNWIINQFRLFKTTNTSNVDRVNLTVTTNASSVESLEMSNP